MSKYVVALILSLALASAALAQSNKTLFRDGDEFRGPVKSVRVEETVFLNQNGERLEGPRVLKQVRNYSADGRRCEMVTYQLDGSSQFRRDVFLYNDSGKLSEKRIYDEADALMLRQVNSFDEDGRLIAETNFGGDETLQQRKVLIYSSAKDRIIEIDTYDGKGVLFRRDVNTYDYAGNKSIWQTEKLDGTADKQTFDLNSPEPRLEESIVYHVNGAMARKEVMSGDSPAQQIEGENYDRNGALIRKTSVNREFDSHKNVVKTTQLRWSKKRGASEPHVVTYNSISYY